jgi:hypothetical protein
LMFSIRSPRWSPRLIQSRNFVIERVAENEIPECPIGSVAIFFFFSLAKFSRLCSFPLPAKPRGGLNQRIIEDSVPLKYEAARKNHK